MTWDRMRWNEKNALYRSHLPSRTVNDNGVGDDSDCLPRCADADTADGHTHLHSPTLFLIVPSCFSFLFSFQLSLLPFLSPVAF